MSSTPTSGAVVTAGPNNYVYKKPPAVHEVRVHATTDGDYVVADQAGWIDGSYATIADALDAAANAARS